MGDMSGTCKTLELSGEIEKVQASYSANKGGGVRAIRYTKGAAKVTYGNLLSTASAWDLDDNSVMLGVHGRVDGSKIVQLGIVLLDPLIVECDSTERIPEIEELEEV